VPARLWFIRDYGTGKSGQYRYYKCQRQIDSGQTVCPGRNISMERLDALVVQALTEHVCEPDHLQTLPEAWLQRSALADEDRRKELKQLRTRLTKLDEENANPIKAVRKGLWSLDESSDR